MSEAGSSKERFSPALYRFKHLEIEAVEHGFFEIGNEAVRIVLDANEMHAMRDWLNANMPAHEPRVIQPDNAQHKNLEASQIAWLVERQENGRAVWCTSNFQWTTDAKEAMWFVREEDAELFCWNTEIEARAVEHRYPRD
jgi:hypothetical protein